MKTSNNTFRSVKKAKTRYHKVRSAQRIKSIKQRRIHNIITPKPKWRLPLPGTTFDYKNVSLLRKCITIQGKILSRRRTGLTAKQQRLMAQVIKHSRMGSLLPFVAKLKPSSGQLSEQQVTTKPTQLKRFVSERKKKSSLLFVEEGFERIEEKTA